MCKKTSAHKTNQFTLTLPPLTVLARVRRPAVTINERVKMAMVADYLLIVCYLFIRRLTIKVSKYMKWRIIMSRIARQK